MLLLGSAATRSHGSGSRHRSRQGSTPYDWLLLRSWRPSRRGASLSAGAYLHGAELQRTRAVPQRCALLPTGCAPQSPIEQALQHPLEPAETPLHPRENAQFFRKRRVSADCNQRGILGGYGPQPGSLWNLAAHWPPNMPGNTGSIRPCCDTRLPSADELRFPFLVFSSKEFS